MKLDAQQEVAWQEARRRRDGRLPPGDNTQAPASTNDPLEFDPQLRRAVELLRDELAAPTAAAKAA